MITYYYEFANENAKPELLIFDFRSFKNQVSMDLLFWDSNKISYSTKQFFDSILSLAPQKQFRVNCVVPWPVKWETQILVDLADQDNK